MLQLAKLDAIGRHPGASSCGFDMDPAEVEGA